MTKTPEKDTIPWKEKTPEQKAAAVTDHLAHEWASGNLRPVSEQESKESKRKAGKSKPEGA